MLRKLRSLPVVALALSTALGPLIEGISRVEQSARRLTAPLIEHLVVVTGENHSFDNLFGVYGPRAGRDAQLVGGCSLTQQPRPS